MEKTACYWGGEPGRACLSGRVALSSVTGRDLFAVHSGRDEFGCHSAAFSLRASRVCSYAGHLSDPS